MLFLTIINALPVKQRMKNAFLENHIFTEYNLSISVNSSLKGLKKMVTTEKILETMSS